MKDWLKDLARSGANPYTTAKHFGANDYQAQVLARQIDKELAEERSAKFRKLFRGSEQSPPTPAPAPSRKAETKPYVHDPDDELKSFAIGFFVVTSIILYFFHVAVVTALLIMTPAVLFGVNSIRLFTGPTGLPVVVLFSHILMSTLIAGSIFGLYHGYYAVTGQAFSPLSWLIASRPFTSGSLVFSVMLLSIFIYTALSLIPWARTRMERYAYRFVFARQMRYLDRKSSCSTTVHSIYTVYWIAIWLMAIIWIGIWLAAFSLLEPHWSMISLAVYGLALYVAGSMNLSTEADWRFSGLRDDMAVDKLSRSGG